MRLIDADVLLGVMQKTSEREQGVPLSMIKWFMEIIAKSPTVESVRGEWIVKEDENCFATWDYCSICGFSTGFAGSSHYINFCPNCGADMRGENDEK